MGSKADVWKAYYEASMGDPPASVVEANMSYLSDDFQSLDKEGNVVANKEAQVGMTQLLVNAFKDFKSVVNDIREEGDSVIVSYHFEGTHTGDLDLSAMELGIIPASGNKIVWPDTTTAFKIEGDKIASTRPYGDSGGMESFLAPFGVTPPSE